MRRIYLVIVLGLVFILGCKNSFMVKDIQGTYVVKYPYGTELLVLKSGGIYEQLFAFNGETLRTINSGNWEIRNIDENQLVLHEPVIVDDGFGNPTNLEKKKNGIWPLRIKKSITGKIHFPINEDLDFKFKVR